MNDAGYVRTQLERFVRIPSSSGGDKPTVLAAATAAIEDLGLRPRVHPDVNVVEASSGAGGVLLNGHLDTVPIGSGWTRGQAVWDGDWLYGRGSADMKAGCVASMATARTLLDRGIPVSLLFTTDEETTMRGSIQLASSPLVRQAAAVVVCEPTGLRVIVSEKGIVWYRVMIRGAGAHGSTPHLGDNAIHRMARVLSHLEPFSRPKDPFSEVTVNVGQIRGGVAPNVVADLCSVDLDCRFPPSIVKAQVDRLLHDVFRAAREQVTLEPLHHVPAAAVPSDAPHIRLLRDLAGTDVGGVTYGTEMAWFAAHNPRCAVFGPGDPARIHVPDERVSLAETVRAAEILSRYAERLRDLA